MNHYPIHTSTNVSLGAMQREYIPLFLPGANDPQVVRGTFIRPPMILEAELLWYEKMAKNERNIIFAILLHEVDAEGKIIGYRYIGHTGLHDLTWPAGHATSGTIIADQACLGKGYGTEAKLLLLYEAFRNRGLHKVCSNVKAFNGNSWGHLLASGFKQVGRRKDHHFYDGAFVDDIVLEVFRADWEPLWQEYQKTKKLPRLTDEQRALLQKEVESS